MAALTGGSARIQEPISVPAVQHGFFPRAFVWRGQRYDVQAVEACRTELRSGWRGQAARHFFRVRTPEAVYEIAQDPQKDTWQLERQIT